MGGGGGAQGGGQGAVRVSGLPPGLTIPDLTALFEICGTLQEVHKLSEVRHGVCLYMVVLVWVCLGVFVRQPVFFGCCVGGS